MISGATEFNSLNRTKICWRSLEIKIFKVLKDYNIPKMLNNKLQILTEKFKLWMSEKVTPSLILFKALFLIFMNWYFTEGAKKLFHLFLTAFIKSHKLVPSNLAWFPAEIISWKYISCVNISRELCEMAVLTWKNRARAEVCEQGFFSASTDSTLKIHFKMGECHSGTAHYFKNQVSGSNPLMRSAGLWDPTSLQLYSLVLTLESNLK